MRRRLRIDVVDSNALSVFVFDLSRNFAGDNFFEECAHGVLEVLKEKLSEIGRCGLRWELVSN